MTTRIRGPVVGAVLFLIYGATSGTSVGWEDSSFFQLALATLGVPHGPGFPLYVLAGHVWTLPFGAYAAWGSNLFSAVAMAGAGAILLELILSLQVKLSDPQASPVTDFWQVAAATGVVLGWGTLQIIWRQAVRTEVYSLTLLLVLLVALLSLRSAIKWDRAPAQARRLALCSAWTWGLAMAVHPLVAGAAATPWLLPPIWRWRRRIRLLLGLALTGLAPFLLYLYPYIRGHIAGVWAWGGFDTIGAALDYYLRRSAWAAVPSTDQNLIENVLGWLYTLYHSGSIALWLPALLALFWLRRTWTLWLSLVSVALLVVWAAPFSVSNLDLWGYFLPFATFGVAAAGVVLLALVRFLRTQMQGLSHRSRQALGYFVISLVVGWPAVSLLAARENFSRAAGAGNLVAMLAASLPDGATVLAAEDNLLGVLTFEQRVEGIRGDLKVVAAGALRYPFYRQQVRDLLQFPSSPLWDSREVWSEAQWEQAVGAWLSTADTAALLFTQFDRIPGLRPDHLSPAGLLYRVAHNPTGPPGKQELEYWQNAPGQAAHDPVARGILARWQFNFGAYAIARGQDQIGWAAVESAVQTTPDDPELYFLLGRALQKSGYTADAARMFAAATDLAPYRGRYKHALDETSRLLAERE